MCSTISGLLPPNKTERASMTKDLNMDLGYVLYCTINLGYVCSTKRDALKFLSHAFSQILVAQFFVHFASVTNDGGIVRFHGLRFSNWI